MDRQLALDAAVDAKQEDIYGAQHLVTATFVQRPNRVQKKKVSESSDFAPIDMFKRFCTV